MCVISLRGYDINNAVMGADHEIFIYIYIFHLFRYFPCVYRVNAVNVYLCASFGVCVCVCVEPVHFRPYISCTMLLHTRNALLPLSLSSFRLNVQTFDWILNIACSLHRIIVLTISHFISKTSYNFVGFGCIREIMCLCVCGFSIGIQNCKSAKPNLMKWERRHKKKVSQSSHPMQSIQHSMLQSNVYSNTHQTRTHLVVLFPIQLNTIPLDSTFCSTCSLSLSPLSLSLSHSPFFTIRLLFESFFCILSNVLARSLTEAFRVNKIHATNQTFK